MADVTWTADLIAKLGKLTDEALARQIGCAGETVRRKREAMGIAAKRVKTAWTEARLRILEEEPDNAKAAARLEVSLNAVEVARSRYKDKLVAREPTPSRQPAVSPPKPMPPPLPAPPPGVWRPLKDKYGTQRVDEAINRAIRAECPGGGLAIDAKTLLYQMAQRLGWRDDRGKDTPICVAYHRVLRIVEAMEDDVRRRWSLPGRQDATRSGKN